MRLFCNFQALCTRFINNFFKRGHFRLFSLRSKNDWWVRKRAFFVMNVIDKKLKYNRSFSREEKKASSQGNLSSHHNLISFVVLHFVSTKKSYVAFYTKQRYWCCVMLCSREHRSHHGDGRATLNPQNGNVLKSVSLYMLPVFYHHSTIGRVCCL